MTEDADLGLRLSHWGYRARMLDSTTYELATAGTGAWLRQRSRWIKGYLQTWLVHARRRPGRGAWRHALTLHFLIGAVGVSALLNPVFWLLYVIWLAGLDLPVETLFPPPLGAMAVAALLLGNAFQLWLFVLAPLRRGWHDLVLFGLTAPAYWVLQSVAGYRALWQLLVRPFYWEKTEHEAGEAPEAIAAKVAPA